MKTRRGVGIVVLGCLAASAVAEVPGKVLGTWMPVNPNSGQNFSGGVAVTMSNLGTAGFEFADAWGPHAVHIVNGTMTNVLRNRRSGAVDDHGNYVTSGGQVNGVQSIYTNSLLHKPDGTVTPVAGDPSIYKYVYVRGMNNAGVMVGHYSAIDQFGDLFKGYAFYRRGGQTWVTNPVTSSTFFAVNDHGRALFGGEGFGSEAGLGVWSPESGFRRINGFGGTATDLTRLDFNNKDEIAYMQPGGGGKYYARFLTPDSQRDILFPAGYNPFIGGFNNHSHLSAYLWGQDPDGVFRYHWMVHRDGQWIDFTDRVLSQLPAGWKLDNLGDIDDYGRTYGIAKSPEGYSAIVHINTVPEPATLGALALGLVALRRKRKVA